MPYCKKEAHWEMHSGLSSLHPIEDAAIEAGWHNWQIDQDMAIEYVVKWSDRWDCIPPVVMFKDQPFFDAHIKRLDGTVAWNIAAFYSRSEDAIVVNREKTFSTTLGTLAHEFAHHVTPPTRTKRGRRRTHGADFKRNFETIVRHALD